MIVRFKDGHKIRFIRYGDIWLAESVIWERTSLSGSLDEFHALKTSVADWFNDNVPDGIHGKYKARLPMWNEIEYLPFKDQIAYKEEKTSQASDYLLGDEDGPGPVICDICYSYSPLGWYCRKARIISTESVAVRLCLEKTDG